MYKFGQLRRTQIESYLTPLTYTFKDIETKSALSQGITFIDKAIVLTGNNILQSADKTGTVIKLFEKQVEHTPQKIAIISNGKHLTYKELNEKANMLSRKMMAKGVKQEDIVGIMVNRSPEMIIGLIAILKCGATYLPIDPEYPAERISYMLDNSETKIILVNSSTEKCVTGEYLKINIELSNKEIYNNNINHQNIDLQIDSKTLAYIIYT